MDLDATQAIPLDDYNDETDEEISQSQKEPVAHLKVPCQKGFPERSFPIYEGDNVIGRQEKCDIWIPIKALSKEHACIEIQGENYLIYDKGSRNKSRRGKLLLTPEVRYELRDEDKLTFADVHCSFLVLPTQQPAAALDSGSETGSESMLPDTQPAQQETRKANIVNDTVLYEDEVNSGDEDSRPSSDLLQATQAYAEDGSGPLLQNPQLTSTLMYAADSEEETDKSIGIPFKLGETVISETPFSRKAQVLPESDVEESPLTKQSGVKQALVFEEENIDEDEKRRILEEPTQAYNMDDDTDEDINEDEKHRMLEEPTQAYNMDDETDDEADKDESRFEMATQAYPDVQEEEAVDPIIFDEPTQAYGTKSDDDDNKSEDMLPATVPYTMQVEGVKEYINNNQTDLDMPTQAYDMDIEEKPCKTQPTSKSKPTEEATLAYNEDMTEESEDHASTQNFDLHESNNNNNNSQVKKKTPLNENVISEDDSATQSYGESTQREMEAATQFYPDYDDTQAKTVAQSKNTKTENEQIDDIEENNSEDATQVFENVETCTSDVSERKDMESENTDVDKTQILAEDSSTLNLMMDVSGGSEVFTPKHNSKSVISNDADETDFDNMATQVYPDESAPTGTDNDKSGSVNSCVDTKSQTINKTGNKKAPKRRSTFDEDDVEPTQNFPDMCPGNESEAAVQAEGNNVHQSEEDDQTQVFTDDSTMPVNDAEDTSVIIPPDNRSKDEKKISHIEDPYHDDEMATQVYPEDGDNTEASSIVQLYKGRPNQSSGQDDDPTLELDMADAPTQAFADEIKEEDIATQPVESEPLSKESESKTQRGRKGKGIGRKSGAKKETDLGDGSTEDQEEVTSPVFGRVMRHRKITPPTVNDADAPTQAFGDIDSTEIPTNQEGASVSQIPTKSPIKSSLASPNRSPDLKSPPKKVAFITEDKEDEKCEPVEEQPQKGRGRPKSFKQSTSRKQDTEAGKSPTEEKTTSTRSSRNVVVDQQTGNKNNDTATTSSKADKNETRSSRRGRKSLIQKTDDDDASHEKTEESDNKKEIANPPKRAGKRGRRSVVEKEEKGQGEGHDQSEGHNQGEGQEQGRHKVAENTTETESAGTSSDAKNKSLQKASEERSDNPEKGANNDSLSDVKVNSAVKESKSYKSNRSKHKTETASVESDTIESTDQVETGEKIEVKPSSSKLKNHSTATQAKEVVSSAVESGRPKRSRRSIYDRSQTAAATQPISGDKQEETASDAQKIENSELRKSTSRKRSAAKEEKNDVSTTEETKEKEDKKNKDLPQRTSSRSASKEEKNDTSTTEETEKKDKKNKDLPQRTSRRSASKEEKNDTSTSEETEKKDKKNEDLPQRTSSRSASKEEKNDASTTEETKEKEDKKNKDLPQRTSRRSAPKEEKNKASTTEEIAEKKDGRDEDMPQRKSGRAVTQETKDTRSTAEATTSKDEINDDMPQRKSGRGHQSKVKSSADVKKSKQTLNPVTTDADGSKEKQQDGSQSDTPSTSASEKDAEVKETGRRGRKRKTLNTENSEKDAVDSDKLVTGQTRGRRKTSRNASSSNSQDDAEKDTDSVASADTVDNATLQSKKAKTKSDSGEAQQNSTRSGRGTVRSSDSVTESNRRTDTKRARASSQDSADRNVATVNVEVPAATPAAKARRATIQPKLPQASPSTSKKLNAIASPPSTPRGSQQSTDGASTPSLRRKSLLPKPKVLFTGVVDEDGEKIIKGLGGSMASTIHDFSHLVTDKTRRTVKFLCALARGLPIITVQWLHQSKTAGHFVDTAPYIINDKDSEKTHKFKLSESLEKASQQSMLTGYKICTTKSVKPEPAQMKDIVKCANGEWVEKLPKKYEDRLLVISCEADQAVVKPAMDLGIPVVSAEFLLTGILRQQVDVDAHQLFQENRGTKRQGGPSTSRNGKKAKK